MMFFFKQKTAYEVRISDWSSDVCSSDPTIGKQHRELCLARAHPHAPGRKHVGPVGEERDPAEALGLALRAQHPARGIKPFELGVGGRIDQIGRASSRDRGCQYE